MITRTLLATVIAVGTLTGLGAAANAQSFDPSSQDRCNPEAWQTFGFAVENRDYDLMAEMLNDAEMRFCDFYATVEVLYCDVNPLACVTPAGGDEPDDVPGIPLDIRRGPFDGPPGASIGNENDGGDSGGGNEPSGGGNEPSGGGDNGRGGAAGR